MTPAEKREYMRLAKRRSRQRLLRQRPGYRKELNRRMRKWRNENPGKYLGAPSRDPLYRKLRRNGIDRDAAAKIAGVILAPPRAV